jgi:hypothetical protein
MWFLEVGWRRYSKKGETGQSGVFVLDVDSGGCRWSGRRFLVGSLNISVLDALPGDIQIFGHGDLGWNTMSWRFGVG